MFKKGRLETRFNRNIFNLDRPVKGAIIITTDLHQGVVDLIREHRAYRLKPFVPILEALLEQFGGVENLSGKHYLELGPGPLVDLIRFLEEEAGAASVRAMGKARTWPWTRNRAYIDAKVEDVFLLEALRKTPPKKYDLICSRRVMERHSIDPWILFFSRRYWRQFARGGFKDLGEDYPASEANIHAIFREAYRTLKPGGVIVSEIARQRFSCIDETFLKTLKPKEVINRSLGRMSSIVVVRKR